MVNLWTLCFSADKKYTDPLKVPLNPNGAGNRPTK